MMKSPATLRVAGTHSRVTVTRAITALVSAHHGASTRAMKPRPRRLLSSAAEPRRRKNAPAGQTASRRMARRRRHSGVWSGGGIGTLIAYPLSLKKRS